MNDKDLQAYDYQPDPWVSLRAFTPARIGLGRTGTAIPLQEVLQFRLAHAHARDAVYSLLEVETLTAQLAGLGCAVNQLHSRAVDRHEYLQRPDKGRRLDEASVARLRSASGNPVVDEPLPAAAELSEATGFSESTRTQTAADDMRIAGAGSEAVSGGTGHASATADELVPAAAELSKATGFSESTPSQTAHVATGTVGREAGHASAPATISIVLADGLSATAVNNHAIPLLEIFLPMLQAAGLSLAPVNVVQQGRVAIGDEVGMLQQAALVVMLIGERPGLSSPDSLGIYLTYKPAIGLTDEARNCISNVRPAGLTYRAAADKLIWFIRASLRMQLSGVGLKDEEGLLNEPTDDRKF